MSQGKTMKKISSRSTFVLKRALPILWFGFLALLAIEAAFVQIPGRQVSLWLFPGLIAASLYGYFFMRTTLFGLADVVFEDGESLVVRKGREEHRIPLTDIVNVSYSPYMSPPRVVLTLRETMEFGKEVAFSAPLTVFPFTKSVVIADLIKRIEFARQRRS